MKSAASGGDAVPENEVGPGEVVAGVVDGKLAILDPIKFEALQKPILDEFVAVLNDLAGTFTYLGIGLDELRTNFVPRLQSLHEEVQASFPDAPSDLLIGDGDPDAPGAFSYQRWNIDQLPERLACHGTVAEQLGQQWVVVVTTQWEHNFRPRLADAFGVRKNDVKDPLFADITRMRNDIVHPHDIATKGNTGRCEVLKWFGEGDSMLVTSDHVGEFMCEVGAITLLGD